ncbi:PEP-CTERM sorting domain-containing protein [Caldimonas brevitalea]|uniref:Ice-binding protein C-terminal domain-containing protein n=1 Tax=Caldimonas brevitalea TaxID=413882 RepID=A0A0G3BL11_9BURK|nr:PEP-CTERM sorting domain-containing protein [Caldimonas brevitalea]AKJ28673.1 hypothetical protein AAW51_1982 [Caldimonas brevitalea]
MKNVIAGLALALTLPVALADSGTARLSNLVVSLNGEAISDWSNQGTIQLAYIPADGEPFDESATITGSESLTLDRPGAQLGVRADWASGLLESTATVTARGAAYSGNTSRDTVGTEFLFLIPANGTLTFSADALVSAATDFLCASDCFSNSFTSLTLQVGSQTFGDDLEVVAGESSTFESLTRRLSLSYTNNTGGEVYARLSAYVDITGQVAAVPEPETYALMGLGLVGVMLQRARKARRAQA